jgi:hypothetical protein
MALLDFQNMALLGIIMAFEGQLQKPFVMEAMILVAWSVWTTRDDHIFKGVRASLIMCKRKLEELTVAIHIARRKKTPIFNYGLATYLNFLCKY